MKELVIKTHDFEESKNQLKIFSEVPSTDFELKRVNSEKDVGEFIGDLILGRGFGTDHLVNGGELNSLSADIQRHLIDINNMHKSFICEIGHVYSALESLDKDYIQAILIAVKSAQKANYEAKVAQSDIEKTIEKQKKIIKVLQKFKEKIDKYEHIDDIDNMWNELQDYQKNIAVTQNTVEMLEQFKVRVDQSEHLLDIDEMWTDSNKQSKEIDDIKEKNITIDAALKTQTEKISELMASNELIDSLGKSVEQLITKLDEQAKSICSNNETISKIESQKYIYSVDEVKASVDELSQTLENTIQKVTLIEQNVNNILSSIETIENICHLSDIDSMYDDIQGINEKMNSFNTAKDLMIEENSQLSNKLEEMEKDFTEKLKIAYAIACGSIGLIVIEFILVMMGLI